MSTFVVHSLPNIGGQCFVLCCDMLGEGARTADKNRLNKLTKKPGSFVRYELDKVQFVAERRMLSKLGSMLNNPLHTHHALEVF